ncbi:cytochrome P450 [Gymnopilus junonius]|uniref:Cytochrome P450 n=1 Tax=Gymnopilus junonius TaxID=109634 RepID=A0A9P5NEZ7_GYMJU|nr:cytochrome P450 [Gymnopilus junonius]
MYSYQILFAAGAFPTLFVASSLSLFLSLESPNLSWRRSFPFLTRYPELTLDYWAKKYGSLYSLWLGINSLKEMYLKSQVVFAGRGITATPYNDRWCVDYHQMTTLFNDSDHLAQQPAVEGYTHVLDYEALVLVQDLYRHGNAGLLPINPQPSAGRCSLNISLRLSREFMNCTGPVSNLIDFVPFLQKIPSYMKARGQKLHADLVETYGGMIHEIDERLKRHEHVPDCLVKTLLQSREEEELDHLDMSILCSAFMIGGVETTASIMQWFSALIPAYPEIQARAHEELDRVVGRDRLPTVDDEKNMPYIHAIIKEVERCHNPFWLGTPHVNTHDFTYRGQFIPKDTVLILNTYTMHHDPQRHPDPHRFNPERYLEDSTLSSESANLSNPLERDHWMFGVGRRICPGMWVAEREVWLVISRMLWAFRTEEIPGEPIDLKEYDGLSGRSPVPFRIKLFLVTRRW